MYSLLRFPVRILAGLSASVAVLLIVGLCSSLAIVIAGVGGNARLPADCALVFGAAVTGYDRPGPAINRRIETAARLYRQGLVKTLIVSGGVGRGAGESVSEANVMRVTAIAKGVQSFNIITEEQSHSTVENVRFSRGLAKDCASVVGVSDGYHLARIRLLASQQGWTDLTVLPTDERPQFISELRSIVREMFAYFYYGLHLDYVLGSPA